MIPVSGAAYHRCEMPGCKLLSLNDTHCVAHRDYDKPVVEVRR